MLLVIRRVSMKPYNPTTMFVNLYGERQAALFQHKLLVSLQNNDTHPDRF